MIAGISRPRLTRQSDGSALSPTLETDGIKVANQYVTASGGNRRIVSNPYRSTSDPTTPSGHPPISRLLTDQPINGKKSRKCHKM